MRDENYILIWTNGSEEKICATLFIRDNCLHVVEHFGVTYGEKSRRVIPLVQLREWRTNS